MTHSGPPRTHAGAWVLVTILLLVAVLGTLIVPIYALVFRASKLPGGSDETRPEHYVADPETAALAPVPVVAEAVDVD